LPPFLNFPPEKSGGIDDAKNRADPEGDEKNQRKALEKLIKNDPIHG